MINLKEYLFNHKDIYDLGQHIRKQSTFQKWIGILLSIAIIAVISLFYSITLESLFFLMFIMASWYWKIDSRVSIGLALVCLVVVPILLALYNNLFLIQGDIWAEKVAVWAFYFLVIGVVKQIFEYREDKA